MTEIEEDLYEASWDGVKETVVRDDGDSDEVIDWASLPGWQYKQIENVPSYELHHGIDIFRDSSCKEDKPIPLSKLNAR